MTNPYLSADLHNLATTWAMVAPRVDTLKLHKRVQEVVSYFEGVSRRTPTGVMLWGSGMWTSPYGSKPSILEDYEDHEVLTAIVSPNDTVTVVPASEALKVLRESEAEQQA